MVTEILNVIPGLQATSLAISNTPRGSLIVGSKKFHNKGIKTNPIRRNSFDYRKGTKNMVKSSVNTMVGIGLLGATANMIGGIK